jgi:VWFA-related protein
VKRCIFSVIVVMLLVSPLVAQSTVADSGTPQTNLRINSRAVLVDVLVTDHDGAPVTGLAQDAFSVTERGNPQTISYFEEHGGAMKAAQPKKLEFPQLPPNVFSNFSPVPAPPAVNILLLDALNTTMADQMYLRKEAKHYLSTLKPGSRLAIFTMGMRLSFVQGFADDPAVLATALGYRKNDKPEVTPLLSSLAETTAQQAVVGQMSQIIPGRTTSQGITGPPTTWAPAKMIEDLQKFMEETDTAQTSDREFRTLESLNQLASFLGAFPGRKNLIWMSGSFPMALFGQTEMRFEDSIKKTINLLAAARIAIYPLDVRGVTNYTLYTAENRIDSSISQASQLLGPPPGMTEGSPKEGQRGFANSILTESRDKNSSDSTADMLARATGGKAFYNGNLSDALGRVVGESANFYTLSYTPTDLKMDGSFRAIDVKVPGGKYTLSYRRGYFARDQDLPGAAQTRQQEALHDAAQSPTTVDPLLPFMELGLPQTEQILYKASIQPLPASDDSQTIQAGVKERQKRYSIDFALDLNDIGLTLAADGLHKGTLNVSLIAYDRYGNVAGRKDHIVALSIKPNVYEIFKKTGVQLHDSIEVPDGQYWLRTGIYDQASHKVGTMEVPLSSVMVAQK